MSGRTGTPLPHSSITIWALMWPPSVAYLVGVFLSMVGVEGRGGVSREVVRWMLRHDPYGPS